MIAIATATRCSCGSPVSVSNNCGEWQAWCPDCYDGTEDAGDKAHVYGHGKTPEEALWAWQEDHDATHEVEWVLASDVIGNLARDVSIEAERQRGSRLLRMSLGPDTIDLYEPGA